MKNFFEFFGFLSMACISAALIFIFLGKKTDFNRASKGGFLSEIETVSEIPDAPRPVSERSVRGDLGSPGKRNKAALAESSRSTQVAPEVQLKSLYNDKAFITAKAREWKNLVRDAADEYNLKPQVLLAHVLVQSYLGDYNRNQLFNDAARHAGERLKPTATAIKGYKYGWSMQKLINDHDLGRYFPEEVSATSTASVGTSKKIEKKTAAKGAAKPSTPVAKNNPIEDGFKNMVAKEYGFASWNGLQKLADPDTKTEATRRVKSLLMAAKAR